MGKSVDQAILKVTYVLSTISGVDKAENKKVFREITKGFPWFLPGDPETDQFVLEIMKTVEDLATLKELYDDDDDYLSVFLARMSKECETIRSDSNATARKGFVIWTAICLADKDLSEFENMALLALQRYMNFGTFSEMEADFALKTQSKSVISDSFKQEVLETIKLMGELKAQIDSTSDTEQKNSLQLSYDILQRQLESKILND